MPGHIPLARGLGIASFRGVDVGDPVPPIQDSL
jgi:hypothetical protein